MLVNENKDETPAVVATAAVLPSATFSAFSRASGTSVVVVVTTIFGDDVGDDDDSVVEEDDGKGTAPVPLGVVEVVIEVVVVVEVVAVVVLVIVEVVVVVVEEVDGQGIAVTGS